MLRFVPSNERVIRSQISERSSRSCLLPEIYNIGLQRLADICPSIHMSMCSRDARKSRVRSTWLPRVWRGRSGDVPPTSLVSRHPNIHFTISAPHFRDRQNGVRNSRKSSKIRIGSDGTIDRDVVPRCGILSTLCTRQQCMTRAERGWSHRKSLKCRAAERSAAIAITEKASGPNVGASRSLPNTISDRMHDSCGLLRNTATQIP